MLRWETVNLKFKRMKKVFMIMAVAIMCSPVFAQDETVIEIENVKGPYVTNGFWDNWFVSAGGGVQVYFGSDDSHGSLGKRFAPALDISAGKWITPSVGVRMQYSGLKAKGWSHGLSPYSEGKADAKGFYKEKFNTMNVHGDFLWNISNAIGGERVDRFWNFVPYVGFGLARSEGNGTSKNELAANAGLLHNLRISDAVDVSIDMRTMFVNQRFAHSNGSDGVNVMATVTAGITYKFNTRGFQRASDLIVVEDNTRYVQEIAQLEGMLRKADQQRSVLEMQLKNVKEELNNANSVEMPVPLMPDLAIFFEIGKADLTQKSIINLGYMADVIKQFPAKSFVIFASADKETGTPEFNMALSHKRGEAVHKVLVEKYGVDPSQLRIDAVGSSQQKFDSAQLNRVVVIEDNE